MELVKTTLAFMPIHAMMVMDLSVKTIEAANKICRGFLWKGRRDVHEGHCLVAWDKVFSPEGTVVWECPTCAYSILR